MRYENLGGTGLDCSDGLFGSLVGGQQFKVCLSSLLVSRRPLIFHFTSGPPLHPFGQLTDLSWHNVPDRAFFYTQSWQNVNGISTWLFYYWPFHHGHQRVPSGLRTWRAETASHNCLLAGEACLSGAKSGVCRQGVLVEHWLALPDPNH